MLVPMLLVLAAGLGAGCYGFPSGKLPTASIDTAKFIDAVKSLADPRFPNFPNAANMPTLSDAALCPSSSARRLFASWDFDDATRELDRPTGGTRWWNFDTRVSARTADASDAPPVLASGLGSGC